MRRNGAGLHLVAAELLGVDSLEPPPQPLGLVVPGSVLAGGIEDRLLDEDRRVRTQREHHGVAGTRIDLEDLPVPLDGEDREVRAVTQIADQYALHARSHRLEDAADEIVRLRA